MRKSFIIFCVCQVVLSTGLVRAVITIKPGPSTIPCFDIYEIIVQLDPPPECNPFTDVKVSATFIPTRLQRAGFTPQGGPPVEVDGFCDDQGGRCFRVRFCPSLAATEYRFSLKTSIAVRLGTPSGADKEYKGSFETTQPQGM